MIFCFKRERERKERERERKKERVRVVRISGVPPNKKKYLSLIENMNAVIQIKTLKTESRTPMID